MSIAAINWALEQSGSPTQKHVLLVLANHADDSGEAFPSTERLCHATGLSDRAVRQARTSLIAAGLLIRSSRFTRNGVRLNMTARATRTAPDATHDRKDTTGAASAASGAAFPASKVAPDAAPHNHHSTTSNHHSSPCSPRKTRSRSGQSTTSKRGCRLPDDWQPSPELIDYASERNLNPEREAEDFRDYWCSKPGAGGLKLDWAATFRTWCRRSADRQQQRSGHGQNVTPFPRPLSQSERNRRASIERIRARQEARRHAQ